MNSLLYSLETLYYPFLFLEMRDFFLMGEFNPYGRIFVHMEGSTSWRAPFGRISSFLLNDFHLLEGLNTYGRISFLCIWIQEGFPYAIGRISFLWKNFLLLKEFSSFAYWRISFLWRDLLFMHLEGFASYGRIFFLWKDFLIM